MTRSIRTSTDGDDAVIRIPLDAIHTIRVAMRPMRVGDVTSNSTQRVRDAFDKALARMDQKGRK